MGSGVGKACGVVGYGEWGRYGMLNSGIWRMGR